MTPDRIRHRGIEKCLEISATRSAGPGGQNVNKVSSRIELRINIDDCMVFSEEEREILKLKLQNKLTIDGNLIVASQTHRSQLMNREEAIEKLCRLIAQALTPVKLRKATRPTRSSVEKRLQAKSTRKMVKQNRRRDDW